MAIEKINRRAKHLLLWTHIGLLNADRIYYYENDKLSTFEWEKMLKIKFLHILATTSQLLAMALDFKFKASNLMFFKKYPFSYVFHI